MLYLRVAAAAAGLLLLGGCSFFGFWDAPDIPAEGPKIDSHGPGGPLEGPQLAALPGYLSDQDVAPGRIGVFRGFIGDPPRSPAGATAAVRSRPIQVRPIQVRPIQVRPGQVRPIKRPLTLKDLLPGRRILDLQPIAAGFEPASLTLADLIADRDWRKRTSETLNRLFQ